MLVHGLHEFFYKITQVFLKDYTGGFAFWAQ